VVDRCSGTLKSERLYRATIGDGNALAVEVNLFRRTCNTLRPPRPPANAYHVRLISPSNTAFSVWSLAVRPGYSTESTDDSNSDGHAIDQQPGQVS
jgi:hypothetical protein